MFLETLAPDTKKVLEQISQASWLKKYYLAGGTALALQYGHRQSIDLDWFTENNFSTKILLSQLQKLRAGKTGGQNRHCIDEDHRYF